LARLLRAKPSNKRDKSNRQYEEPPVVALPWIRGGVLTPHTTHRRRIWKA
jgi:hypothetical protein